MLQYFTPKKFKKNKTEKEQKDGEQKVTSPAIQNENEAKVISSPPAVETPTASSSKAEEVATPLLTDDDERFLERLTTPSEDDDGPAPPLPPRVSTPELTWDSDSESFVKPTPKAAVQDAPEGSKSAGKKPNRLSALFTRSKKKDSEQQLVAPTNLAMPEPEVDREQADLTRVLDDLNLSARNNTAFALSQESTELVRRFTLILKDLVNGVPTAVNDLTSLLDDPDGKLAKNYEKLPKSLKKLVTQLPEKLSSTLAPELLAVAAEAQGLGKADAAAKGGLKGAAKRMFLPKNLAEMVTKPGAIVGMLRGIMNALKLRWPAFIGTNVIWSIALFCEYPSSIVT
jgi:hypothetical protein